MAYSVFDYTSRANPNLLAERMFRQQWKRNSFGVWVAPEFVKVTRPKEEVGNLMGQGPQWTGAPIEVHQEFVKQGRTTLDIPVRNRLVEMPVHGDKPLRGTAERAVIAFRTVYVNYTRKAYAPPTGMSFQIVKKYADNLVFAADEYLRQWWNDYHPSNFILTMCAGASRDLVAPTAEGGRNISYVSHPNFIVAGSGPVGYGGGRPGSSGYELSVESALNGLSNTAVCWMSVALIENMVLEAARYKMAPIVMERGFSFYPVWISDAQWKQLQRDPEFRDFYKRLPTPLAGSPLATGAVAKIGGAVIYVDMNLFGARTNATDSNVTAGAAEYGPAPSTAERALGFKIGNTMKNLDTSNLKVGFIMGQGSMSVGIGERMNFTDLIDDHGFVKEVGIATIQSVVRSDVYDHDGLVAGLTAGQFYENTGSLAFATYSPHTFSYS